MCYRFETHVTALDPASPEPASPSVEPPRPHLAQAEGPRRRRAQERRLPPALLARPLRAVPVARAGSSKEPRGGDAPQGGPRRERETVGRRPPIPRGTQRRLCSPHRPLPQARHGPAAAGRRRAGPAGPGAGSADRHRLLRCAGTAAGAAGAGSSRSAARADRTRAAPGPRGASIWRRCMGAAGLPVPGLTWTAWRRHGSSSAFSIRRRSLSLPRPTRCPETSFPSTWPASSSAITEITAPSRPCFTVSGLRDRRLAILAEIVHEADLRDGKFSREEARGLDLVLRGLLAAVKDDHEALAQGLTLFDGLYATIGERR